MSVTPAMSLAPGRLPSPRSVAPRDQGRKLLVPYVTGGLDGWVEALEAIAGAGADAIEIGIPFSDPVMDGPTIQEASVRALAAGATPDAIVTEIGRAGVARPAGSDDTT